jgi:hypothetical protein
MIAKENPRKNSGRSGHHPIHQSEEPNKNRPPKLGVNGVARHLQGIDRDEVKIRLALGREHLRQMSEAQQFQNARCHVGEFEDAIALVDCGGFEPNQRSETRAV